MTQGQISNGLSGGDDSLISGVEVDEREEDRARAANDLLRKLEEDIRKSVKDIFVALCGQSDKEDKFTGWVDLRQNLPGDYQRIIYHHRSVFLVLEQPGCPGVLRFLS